MLSRVQRWARGQKVDAFEWVGVAAPTIAPGGSGLPALSAATIIDDSEPEPHSGLDLAVHPREDLAPQPAADVADQPGHDLAEIERDGFNQGFAQGERAGNEAAATREEAMLRRLARTIDELAVLRSDMVQNTERQLVQLALAIARRITLRELSIDRTLLSAIAHVALDRLGETAAATIRLNPEDVRAITPPNQGEGTSGSVRVVADPSIPRGGCVVQADFGLIDVGVEAQLSEIRSGLLGDGAASEDVAVVAA